MLLRILPVMGGRGEEYRNCRRMSKKVCMEEGVGFIDMWLNFVGRDDFLMRDGLHVIGKVAAVLGCERYHKLVKLDVQRELKEKLKGVQIHIQRNVHQSF